LVFKRRFISEPEAREQLLAERQEEMKKIIEEREEILEKLQEEEQNLRVEHEYLQGQLQAAVEHKDMLQELLPLIEIYLHRSREHCLKDIRCFWEMASGLCSPSEGKNEAIDYEPLLLEITENYKRAEDEYSAGREENKAAGKLDETSTPPHSRRAFITDDDSIIRSLLKIILEREGFEVIESGDGRDASRRIAEMEPPDICILDIMLPFIDGRQLVRQIRTKSSWKSTPIIMLTSSSSEKEIVDLLEAGANDYMLKPFNTRELSARVRRLTGYEIKGD